MLLFKLFLLARSIPFRVEVHFDENEVTTNDNTASMNEQVRGPAGIIGFSLDYVQQNCA